MPTDWDLKAQISALERRVQNIGRPVSRDEADAMQAARTRADSVATLFGHSVAGPVPGETELGYRKRLAGQFQKHSPRFRETRLTGLDAATFNVVEGGIYADAQAAGIAAVEPGTLKAVTERVGGRDLVRYHGDWRAAFGAFCQPGVSCAVRDPRKGQ